MARPTEYTDEMPEKLVTEMYNGLSVERFCRKIRICKDTFYVWVKKHAEFADAFRLGRNDCEAYWEEWLIERLESKDVNSNLVKLIMANRFGWSDKAESKHEVKAELSDTTDRRVRNADEQYR